MGTPVRIGMDTSKSVFQLHGVDDKEAVVLHRQFRRNEMIRYFEKPPPTLVAIESCGSSHHWARLLQSFGHEVKLIPPQYVEPYVKRGKNDTADAEALCEAVTRPTMRFVPVKSRGRQAACGILLSDDFAAFFASSYGGVATKHMLPSCIQQSSRIDFLQLRKRKCSRSGLIPRSRAKHSNATNSPAPPRTCASTRCRRRRCVHPPYRRPCRSSGPRTPPL
jgi:hypothetical protein